MLKKWLIIVIVLAAIVAVPTIAISAEEANQATDKNTQINQPTEVDATDKPVATETPKATQEENLAKFKSAPDSAVVAIVGDKEITKGDLLNIMWEWKASITLDEYINYLVVTQALEKEGLKVTDSEIQEKLMDRQIPPGETIETMVQRVKESMAHVKAGYTIQMALQKIMEKRTVITDVEYAGFIKARHILVRVAQNITSTEPPTPEDRAKADKEALEKVQKIVAEIKGGLSFDDAAKKYSDDTMTKETGGDLGWFQRGDKYGEVSAKAFELKPGEVSEPIKSYMGYHIVMVDKYGKDATDEEKAALKEQILAQKIRVEMGKLFNSIKSDTKIENFISPTLPELPRQGGMMPGNPRQMPSGR